jgi:hypothetical protein
MLTWTEWATLFSTLAVLWTQHRWCLVLAKTCSIALRKPSAPSPTARSDAISSPRCLTSIRSSRQLCALAPTFGGHLPGKFGQWIVDGVRLTEGNDSGINRHGVSLRGGSGRIRHPPRYAAFNQSSSPRFQLSCRRQTDRLLRCPHRLRLGHEQPVRGCLPRVSFFPLN